MGEKMKVLLVEDDPDARAIFEEMLSGYDIKVANNGEKAVKLYRRFRPDVVLMDVVLPSKDGVEAAKEILSFDENAKIIAITAYARQNREKILEAGILEILEKPFFMKDLLEVVERYGRRKEKD